MQIKWVGKKPSLTNATLLLGAGVGWIGSMSLDLLINSLNFEHKATILSEDVLQIAGNSVFSFSKKTEITTTIELYCKQIENQTYVIIQIRGPIMKNRNAKFVDSLISWSKEEGISEIVLLFGADATRRNDQQLLSDQQRVLYNSHYCELNDSKLNDCLVLENATIENFIRAQCFTQKLRESCDNHSLKLLILIRFCSEGDNLNDCVEFVSFVEKFLHLFEYSKYPKISLRFPPSWSQLFNTPLLSNSSIF